MRPLIESKFLRVKKEIILFKTARERQIKQRTLLDNTENSRSRFLINLVLYCTTQKQILSIYKFTRPWYSPLYSFEIQVLK